MVQVSNIKTSTSLFRYTWSKNEESDGLLGNRWESMGITHPSAYIYSDHFVVAAQFLIRLSRVKTVLYQTQRNLEIGNLQLPAVITNAEPAPPDAEPQVQQTYISDSIRAAANTDFIMKRHVEVNHFTVKSVTRHNMKKRCTHDNALISRHGRCTNRYKGKE